jgi:hypothetical protein
MPPDRLAAHFTPPGRQLQAVRPLGRQVLPYFYLSITGRVKTYQERKRKTRNETIINVTK